MPGLWTFFFDNVLPLSFDSACGLLRGRMFLWLLELHIKKCLIQLLIRFATWCLVGLMIG